MGAGVSDWYDRRTRTRGPARDPLYEDLVGVPEIAEALGVPHDRVAKWIIRRETVGCPEPVRVLRMGMVYSLAEWKGWYALWRVTREPADPRPFRLRR